MSVHIEFEILSRDNYELDGYDEALQIDEIFNALLKEHPITECPF